MPKYNVKCEDGHESEMKMSYEAYDCMKSGEGCDKNFHCQVTTVGGTHFTDPSLVCRKPLEVVLTPIPFVFAVNDGDFAVSKKKFGMGNLTEI